MFNKDAFLRQFTTAVISEQSLGNTSNSDAAVTEIDLGEVLPERFSISAKIVTNGTAPGASLNAKVNAYWSDESVATANVAAQLASRKVVGANLALPNAANTTRFYEVQAGAIPKGRYLYLSLDNDVLAVGASIAVTVNLNRL